MSYIVNDIEYETLEEMQAALDELQEQYDAYWQEINEKAEAERPLSAEELLAALIQQTNIVDELPDEVIAKMSPYFPLWDSTTTYTIGDRVSWDNKVWRCLMGHTAQETWTPDVSPSLWAKVLIPDPEMIPEWEQPDSTNPYMKDDKVTHNGKTWISDVDNNVWEPGVYGWSETV